MAKKVTFTLAPEIVSDATDGLLLGDFNNWLHEAGIQMKKQKDGSLKATLELEPGVYQYRYFLSDGRWVNDGNANGYSFDNAFGVDNCVINVAAEEVKTKKVAAKKAAPAKVEEKPKATAKKAAEPVKKAAPAAPKAKAAVKEAPKAAAKKAEVPAAKKATKKTK